MRTSDFTFDLPSDRIAQRPLPRGESRLLVVDETGEERHRRVTDLARLVRAGDLLVVNDTRVIPARLFGVREAGGGRVEALLLEPLERGAGRTWQALVRPGRRLRPGTRIRFGDETTTLGATVTDRLADGRAVLAFARDPRPLLGELGHVPLPPYIQRQDDRSDLADYQTVFARQPGAVAAPTAGLHFDQAQLAALDHAGVGRVAVTLHVGIGTFKPVTVEDIDDHRMERERYRIGEEAATRIAETRARGGRVVAIGTTVVRSLESAAQPDGTVSAGEGSSALFIRPGYRFRVVDLLLTNFHLPRSTLIMLVCALAGTERVLAAYEEAVERGYRFYSYGDAMLASRRPGVSPFGES